MQERRDLPPPKVNDDLLRFSLRTPLWFWFAAAGLGLVVAIGVYNFGLMVTYGLQVLGLTYPVYWAVLITNFVFWVGISHAGVMISAILRLTQAEWRRPVTRAAEVLTVFALATAALFPLIHTGRPWRAIYWVFPYDFARGIWPDVRSALIWDPSAIFTYLTGSSMFVYVALLPDLAVARDRSTGWRRRLYGLLALGFHGTARQWRLQTIAGILLSALILPVFVSVHSIVSFDFAMAIVPGWHSTVFAPYFVIGAVHSGVSAVATLMAVLRRIFRLEDYITPDHFDALGRLLVVVSTTWLFFFLMDFYFGIYSREPAELAMWELRVFTWPYNLLFAIFLLTGYIIPVPFWLFRRCRRNVAVMFWTSLLVNVGMWLERYILIVPPLSYKHMFPFTWMTVYEPRPAEYLLVIASFALVSLGILLFSKIFPIIPLFDIKEGQVLKQEVQIGRVKVPAVIRE
ncbi:MAG TPA: NrfD/PsrC family molybdoenzyme membrane anchor subunit [Chloroflexota bacterium]|nr:NrfD/PsrC family molybdoenzyme membrane anchor subunit [Chloroflexota bacterium]